MPDGTPKPLKDNTFIASAHAKAEIRRSLVLIAKGLIGIPYRMRKPDETDWTIGKWIDLSKPPVSLDCSGLTHGVYKSHGLSLPHGSQNQFNETIVLETGKEQQGDLAFFGSGKDITRIYHVGIIYDDEFILESRAFDPKASFPTGKVILRPKERWEKYSNFCGYRVHEKLI